MNMRRSAEMRIPKAAELVAQEIRRQIVLGDVDADDALPNESELVEVYGVSRPTIREALRLLEADGLIEVKRGVHGGPRVRLPDVSVTARHASLLLQMRGVTVADLGRARLFLETASVRELADRASEDDAAALRASIEAERSAGGDVRESAHRATMFHALLVELAGNRTLSLLYELVLGIMDSQNRTIVESLDEPTACEVVESARETHGHLVRLIESGAVEDAEELWRDHLRAASERVAEVFGEDRLVDIHASASTLRRIN